MKIQSDINQAALALPAIPPRPDAGRSLVDFWPVPATIAPNNFIHKSLSQWAFNIAVGCSHACRFCYGPDASAIKLGRQLAPFGVRDPDSQWGDYLLLRPWDEKAFLRSLISAERTPRSQLKRDGNRAVIYCSTTDPYQAIRHPDPGRCEQLAQHARFVVRRSLGLIRDASTLNVRILTRSPLARQDFALFASFGRRLTFGMSLPTLRNDLARIYEPKAPAPTQRLAALKAAREAGLHVFVAMAPTYPDCDATDLEATLAAIASLDPVTVFHEPINIRAENVARIQTRAAALGVRIHSEVFASKTHWQSYAIDALLTVQRLAGKLGIADRLHLWPDKSLGTQAVADSTGRPEAHLKFIHGCWHRISEWPKQGK